MKVAFFAPHSALWPHAFPEALLAEALAQNGHEILYLTCGRVFDRQCVVMTSMGFTFDTPTNLKERACNHCDLNKHILRREFNFKGVDIASVLTHEDFDYAEQTLSGITRDNFLEATFNGVEYGRAALSTFVLIHKKNQLQLSDKEWQILLSEVRNSLLSLIAASRIFEQEKPDRLVLYSPGYSVNLVWARLATRLGVPQYYIQAGSNLSDRLQKLTFVRGLYWQGLIIKQWERFRNLPCSPSAAHYVTDHFLELIRGRSVMVYSLGRSSEGVNVRTLFGISSDQKLMVATMSSYDELFAGEITGQIPHLDRGAFRTQIEWIKSIINFVAQRQDLFLLIRVHPREFPNRRDGVKSEHGTQLEEQLRNLPENARVNWPSDGVSLYNLAEEMDLCLNAWSNAGKEMTLLGIPVLLYSTETSFYHPGINYAADTDEEYFRLIDKALDDGWQFENSRAAFRWYALEDLYSRIELSESVHIREHQHPLPWPTRALRKLIRIVYPGFQQVRDSRRRAPRLRMGQLVARAIEAGDDSLLDILGPQDFPDTTPAEESLAIRREFRRLAHALYGPRFEGPGGKLKKNLLQLIAEPAIECATGTVQSSSSRL